jgi:hypothetical protein
LLFEAELAVCQFLLDGLEAGGDELGLPGEIEVLELQLVYLFVLLDVALHDLLLPQQLILLDSAQLLLQLLYFDLDLCNSLTRVEFGLHVAEASQFEVVLTEFVLQGGDFVLIELCLSGEGVEIDAHILSNGGLPGYPRFSNFLLEFVSDKTIDHGVHFLDFAFELVFFRLDLFDGKGVVFDFVIDGVEGSS